MSRLAQELENVIEYSQGYYKGTLKSCDVLISQWLTSKSWMFDYFDEDFTWFSDEPYATHLSKQECHELFDRFIAFIESSNFFKYNCIDSSSSKTFGDWIMDNEDGFFYNSTISSPPGSAIKVGSKLLKNFKYFFEDELALRVVQDYASQIIQSSRIEGYLYFSIHPLSYMTISENNYNWRSCHALDGDYRVGNLSYMVDDCTIVAGLVSKKEKHNLKCMPSDMAWYDNKWRMLIHTNSSRNFVYYNKQYPFFNEDLLDLVNTKLKDLFKKSDCYFHGPYGIGYRSVKLSNGSDAFLPNSYAMLCGKPLDLREIIIEPEEPVLFFNDLLYSHNYALWIGVNEKIEESDFWYKLDAGISKWHKDIMRIEIGREVLCPCCGVEYIIDSENFICRNCEQDVDRVDRYKLCSMCNRRIYDREELCLNKDLEIICKDCYNAIYEQKENDE